MLRNKKVYLLVGILLIGAFATYFAFSQNDEENIVGNFISAIIPSNVVYADTLNEIETEMTYLMSDIVAEMRSNPQMAMLGHPIQFIRGSDSYKNIVALGLKAVKPLYDKLYDSRDAGLYEYILAMAVQEITQENFVYNVDYGWKNSLEFRMAFEEKVNNVKFRVENIIADERLSDSQKAQQFKELGVFAVSSLIEEYNNINSKIPKDLIEESIKEITAKYEILPIGESIKGFDHTDSDFINQNKELFDSLVDLNGKAYK